MKIMELRRKTKKWKLGVAKGALGAIIPPRKQQCLLPYVLETAIYVIERA